MNPTSIEVAGIGRQSCASSMLTVNLWERALPAINRLGTIAGKARFHESCRSRKQGLVAQAQGMGPRRPRAFWDHTIGRVCR